MGYNRKDDAWEQYESLPTAYFDDPRWKKVSKLRKAGVIEDNIKANELVLQIREDYGFKG